MADIRIKLDPKAVRARTLTALDKGMVNCITGLHGIVVHKVGRTQPIVRKTSRSGRTYKVGLAPSAPGEPPKVLTGTLKKAMTWEVDKGTSEVRGRVGSNVEYHRALELGFVDQDKLGRNQNLQARPHLRPGITENRAKLFKLFVKGTRL